jgi:hypothetical protein
MQLGTFSISLAVKDLEASRSFDEKFGFAAFAGDASQNWLIPLSWHVRQEHPYLQPRMG